jgi:hypothetical protein
LWRHLTNALVRVLYNNAGLLYHQPISHWHIPVGAQLPGCGAAGYLFLHHHDRAGTGQWVWR